MTDFNSLQNCCRICAKYFTNFYNIHEEAHNGKRPIEMLEFCLQQPIDTTAHFPDGICSICILDLITTFEFFQLYKESERHFLSLRQGKSDEAEVKIEIVYTPEINEIKEEAPIQFEEIDCDEVGETEEPFDESEADSIAEPIVEQMKNKEPKYIRSHKREFVCDICHKVLSRKQTLDNHKKTHQSGDTLAKPCEVVRNSDRPFQCMICHSTFKTTTDLENHKKFHATGWKKTVDANGDIRFTCNLCDKVFVSYRQVVDHIHIHTREFTCDRCSGVFARRAHLNYHKKTVHDSESSSAEQFRCDCGRIFISKATLIMHMRTHSEESDPGGPFECFVCSFWFESLSSLRAHKEIHRESYECFDCKQTFESLVELQEHMADHLDNPRQFECNICHSTYKSLAVLFRHKKNVHQTNFVYDCEYCTESFKKSSDVRFHVKAIHKSEMKTYKCNQCLRKFPMENLLDYHKYSVYDRAAKSTHLFPQCGKTFPTGKEMELHQLSHSDVRSFACTQCHSKFQSRRQLQIHLISHLNKRPQQAVCIHDGSRLLECNTCHSTFATSTELENHEKMHAIACDLCDKVFMSRDKWRGHVSNHTKKFVCDICDKMFHRKRGLDRHKIIHDSERPFQCRTCHSSFATTTERENHEKLHATGWKKTVEANGDTRFTCNLCDKVFVSYKQVVDHIRIHTREFTCDICDGVFARRQQLDHHKKTVHDSESSSAEQFRCDCGQIFNLHRAFTKHMQTHLEESDPGGPFECFVCSTWFESLNSLRAHKEIHRESYECFDCKQTFEKLVELQRHMADHLDKPRQFECNICHSTYKSITMLFNHKKRLHRTQLVYDCEYCKESFEKGSDVWFHIKMFHKNEMKTYKCNQCSRTFPSGVLLDYHKYSVHDRAAKSTHLCPQCGKTFPTGREMDLHQLSHSDDRPFACTQCPSTFKSKSQLKSHLIYHLNEQTGPVICDICNKTYPHIYSLQSHKKIHIAERQFACDSCPKAFLRRDHLTRHIRSHTGEKPYKCEFCDRAFTQSNDMEKHKRTHLGENMYKCDECNESFRLKTELKKHSIQHFNPAMDS